MTASLVDGLVNLVLLYRGYLYEPSLVAQGGDSHLGNCSRQRTRSLSPSPATWGGDRLEIHSMIVCMASHCLPLRPESSRLSGFSAVPLRGVNSQPTRFRTLTKSANQR